MKTQEYFPLLSSKDTEFTLFYKIGCISRLLSHMHRSCQSELIRQRLEMTRDDKLWLQIPQLSIEAFFFLKFKKKLLSIRGEISK